MQSSRSFEQAFIPEDLHEQTFMLHLRVFNSMYMLYILQKAFLTVNLVFFRCVPSVHSCAQCFGADAGIHCYISHADLSCLILPLLRHSGGGRDL